MTKFKSIIVAGSVAVAGLALTSPVSHAAVINTLFQAGVNTMQDADVERVLRDGVAVTDGAFAVGDVIESILRFDTVNAAAISDTLAAPYQLTAYSQLRVDSILDLGGGNVRLVFGDNFNVLGVNVLVEVYERTSALQPSYSASAAPAIGIANVLGQTLIAEFGLSDIDDFWVSDQINDIGVIAGASPGSGQAANGVFGLSILSNAGGLPIGPNGILSPIDGNLHDLVGDASVYARETGVNTGWLVSSNLNASFNNVVPEPGTLTLLGLALTGLGVFGRRRKI